MAVGSKLVFVQSVKHNGVRYAPGDECPPELAKSLPEGAVAKESDAKKADRSDSDE